MFLPSWSGRKRISPPSLKPPPTSCERAFFAGKGLRSGECYYVLLIFGLICVPLRTGRWPCESGVCGPDKVIAAECEQYNEARARKCQPAKWHYYNHRRRHRSQRTCHAISPWGLQPFHSGLQGLAPRCRLLSRPRRQRRNHPGRPRRAHAPFPAIFVLTHKFLGIYSVRLEAALGSSQTRRPCGTARLRPWIRLLFMGSARFCPPSKDISSALL